MKKIRNIVVALGIVAALTVAVLLSNVISFAQPTEAQTIKQWETAVVRGTGRPESLQGAMNIRGNEGWELVDVVETKEGNFVAFLKRQKN